MGLDISVYKVEGYLGTDIERTDDMFCVYGATGFEDRADDMEGCYKNGEYMFSFRAGSYGGYNWWRDVLSDSSEVILNNDRYRESLFEKTDAEAFMELIWFSDCEGFIGTETSKKLYNDFESLYKPLTRELLIHQHTKGQHPTMTFIVDPEQTTDFLSVYKDFMKAFKLASEVGGIVLFH